MIYDADYTGKFSFCGVEDERLIELFRNGSIIGKLAEDLVCVELPYKKADNTQDYYDVVGKKDGTKWEARCLTKYGANLIPANQIGAGRSYNEKEFFDKLDNIDGYIIIDIREFPKISFYRFGGWEVYNKFGRKITTKDFNNFLKEMDEI